MPCDTFAGVAWLGQSRLVDHDAEASATDSTEGSEPMIGVSGRVPFKDHSISDGTVWTDRWT